MQRWLRRFGLAIGVLLALGLVAYGCVYLRSQQILTRTYAVPRTTLQVPGGSDAVAAGQRLATLIGCYGMCHGRDAEGRVMFEDRLVARFVAPSLGLAVRRYSDAELDGLIRHGVRPDGRSLVVMPSQSYQALDDADLGRIIAFLRSLPPRPAGTSLGTELYPLGRLGVALGELQPAAQMVVEAVPPPPATGGDGRGRYLARIACGPCHAPDLRGESNPDFTSPNLQVARGYSSEAFTTLLRTGVALGGRELRTMSPAARKHLALLEDDEIADLYAYLHTLGDD